MRIFFFFSSERTFTPTNVRILLDWENRLAINSYQAAEKVVTQFGSGENQQMPAPRTGGLYNCREPRTDARRKTGGLYKINCHEQGRFCRGRSGFIGPGTGPPSVWKIEPSTTTIRESPVRPKSPNRLYKGLQQCAFAVKIFDSTESIIEDAHGSSSRFAAPIPF